MAKKTWIEKLESQAETIVKPVPMNFAGMKKGQIMLIPTPQLIDAYIRAIPTGEERTVPVMRTALAQQEGTEVCCPVTTGIHLRTVAEAAFEKLDAGADVTEITPVWRVLSSRTPTTKKVSFDTAVLLHQRVAEGFEP